MQHIITEIQNKRMSESVAIFGGQSSSVPSTILKVTYIMTSRAGNYYAGYINRNTVSIYIPCYYVRAMTRELSVDVSMPVTAGCRTSGQTNNNDISQQSLVYAVFT